MMSSFRTWVSREGHGSVYPTVFQRSRRAQRCVRSLSTNSELQTVQCSDLYSPDPRHRLKVKAIILKAFSGPNALGVIAVEGVQAVPAARADLLPLASRLASLPQNVLSQYTDPSSSYSIGWSHGKEHLDADGPDLHKGSFYANPLCDDPLFDGQDKLPCVYRSNIWPKQHIPELEPAFKHLGTVMCDVATRLLYFCDEIVRESAAVGEPSLPANGSLPCTSGRQAAASMAPPLPEQRGNMGRLLHYYAMKPGDKPVRWCARHVDHGTLTGLTAAMFLPSQGYVTEQDEIPSPDSSLGLYVCTRQGHDVRVAVPKDQLVYQAGQALQIMSGGMFQATEHYVRGPSTPMAVSRNTFAVFCQPNAEDELAPLISVPSSSLGVPKWREGMTFGEFAQSTMTSHYL